MSDATAPQIFVSSASTDRERVRELYAELIAAGLRPIWDQDLDLGTYWPDEMGKARIVLVCLSAKAVESRRLEKEVQLAVENKKLIVPVFLERGVMAAAVSDPFRAWDLSPTFLALEDYTGVDLSDKSGLLDLVAGLKRIFEAPSSQTEVTFSIGKAIPAKASAPSLLLRRISLIQIRCFEALDLDLADDAKPSHLTMILGDNATGKSTLLRSIALGLASESDASALIKQLPGPFVRREAEEGTIRLELCDPDNGRELTITTRILNGGTPDEKVRKETDPDPFPWEDVFVCAYGTNRSRQAAASYETYTLHQAVLSLFDDDTVLQNPEVVLLRLEPALRTEVEQRLLRILMLEEPDYEVTYPRTGLEIRGPWGQQPLRSLSDGYRSTAQWVLDFLAWSIYAGRLANGGDVGGILIVDELEQHLHPRWQRHIVQRLRQQFPKTQIFASTHTPLAAAGTADVEDARLLRLRTEPDGTIASVEIDPRSLTGLRADQVLASDAFGLYTSRNPGSEDDMTRFAELLGKEPRSEAEGAELERLRESLEVSLRTGESEAEREVEQAVDAALRERVTKVKPELLDLEARRQLHELFAGDKTD